MGKVGKWLIRNLPFVADEHDSIQDQFSKLRIANQRLELVLDIAVSNRAMWEREAQIWRQSYDSSEEDNGKLKVELELSQKRRELADQNFAKALLLEVELQDKLASTIVELESTKRKLVATPPEQPILKAKTAAEARKLAVQAFAREEEETTYGIQ